MVSARDAARAAKDYGESDRLRDELAAMGLEVMDGPEGTTVRPRD
jgi:cysteinyl-tRNA synthetase